MTEQKRNGFGGLALMMHEVNVERAEALHLNLSPEVWQFVDCGLSLPPIKPILPVFDKSLHVGERSAVRPLISSSKLIGKSSNGEFFAQNLQCFIRHIDRVR